MPIDLARARSARALRPATLAASPRPGLLEPLEARRMLAVLGDTMQLYVRPETTHQTIDGFGSSMIDWASPKHYEKAEFYNDIATDLGASIVRLPIPADFELANDNDDPNVVDKAGFDVRQLEPTMQYTQELEKRLDQTVMGTVWSPPWWMKLNHDVRGGGGYVKPEMRAEFAEFLAEYVIAAKEEFGVDVDVIALQNEPLFTQTFVSTIYSPEELALTFYEVQSHFEERGLDTRLSIAEDLNFGRRLDVWTKALKDVYAKNNRPLPEMVWGTHYSDFPSLAVIRDTQRDTGMPVWQTEAGGKGTESETAGLFLVEEALQYIREGRMSAYVIWQSVGDGTSSWWYQRGTNADGSPKYLKSGSYAGMKHLSRWVRPGSQVLDSVAVNSHLPQDGNASVRSVAFRSPDKQDQTVVMANMARYDRTVTVDLGSNAALRPDGPWRSYLTRAQGSVGGGADNGNVGKWVRNASQTSLGGTGEVPVSVSADGRTVSFTIPARSMLTVTTFDDNPVDEAKTATTGRSYQYVPGNYGMQGMSYGHHLVGVGYVANMDTELPDDQARRIFDGGRGLLHLAGSVAIGDVPGTVAKVLERAARLGLDINLQDHDGMTPLMVAAGTQKAGQAYKGPDGHGVFVLPRELQDRLSRFVEFGADLHVKDDLGRTALHWAGITSRAEVVLVSKHEALNVPRLLELGADKNKVDYVGKTPLDWAVSQGNVAHADALRNWTKDTAAPELLSAVGESSRFKGATLTWDEKLRAPRASDYLLVREDGRTAAAAIRATRTLSGGNTQVEVVAADPKNLPAGHWRVYPVVGGAADTAGNTYKQPVATRGRNAVGSAAFAHVVADADGNRKVDAADRAVVMRSMNRFASGPSGGDFNGDGWVNLLDLAVWQQSNGTDLTRPPTGTFGGREPAGGIAATTATASAPATTAKPLVVTSSGAAAVPGAPVVDATPAPFAAGVAPIVEPTPTPPVVVDAKPAPTPPAKPANAPAASPTAGPSQPAVPPSPKAPAATPAASASSTKPTVAKPAKAKAAKPAKAKASPAATTTPFASTFGPLRNATTPAAPVITSEPTSGFAAFRAVPPLRMTSVFSGQSLVGNDADDLFE